MVAFLIIFAAAGYTLGTGRTVPTVAAALGLVSVIVGVVALFRPATGWLGSPASIVLGLISVAVGVPHAAYAAGTFGTGNGLAGAILAIVLGLIGTAVGGLALVRSRRTA